MEIREYFNLLKRFWWIPLIIAAIFAGVAYYTTPRPSTFYSARTTVLLSQGTAELPDIDDISAGQRVASTYSQLMTTQAVLDEVIANLGLNTSAGALRGRITIAPVATTNLLHVSATAGNAQEAADVANEVVRVFIKQNSEQKNSRYSAKALEYETEISQLEIEVGEMRAQALRIQWDVEELQQRVDDLERLRDTDGLNGSQQQELEQLRSQLIEKLLAQTKHESDLDQKETRYLSLLNSLEEVRLLEAQTTDFMSIIEFASTGFPVTGQSRKMINAMQGAVAGIVLGLGIIFLTEQLRTTVKTTNEVEQTVGVPTYGMIADIKGAAPKDKLIVSRQPRSPIAEAYRVIRSNIDFAKPDGEIKTLVVTSSSPAEGKTVTTANLAATMAQAGKRVILVDADLRRPTMHKIFSLSNSRGVTTAITMGRERGDSISEHLSRTSVDNLYLMPSGPLPPNPADILGSDDMLKMIQELREIADVVIFDTPPVLAVADPSLLARICDATLLVVLANSTRLDALRQAAERLTQSRANLVGVIMNRISASENGYYHYYYSHGE